MMQEVIYKKKDGILKNAFKSVKLNQFFYLYLFSASLIIGLINKNINRAFFTLGTGLSYAYIIHIIY